MKLTNEQIRYLAGKYVDFIQATGCGNASLVDKFIERVKASNLLSPGDFITEFSKLYKDTLVEDIIPDASKMAREGHVANDIGPQFEELMSDTFSYLVPKDMQEQFEGQHMFGNKSPMEYNRMVNEAFVKNEKLLYPSYYQSKVSYLLAQKKDKNYSEKYNSEMVDVLELKQKIQGAKQYNKIYNTNHPYIVDKKDLEKDDIYPADYFTSHSTSSQVLMVGAMKLSQFTSRDTFKKEIDKIADSYMIVRGQYNALGFFGKWFTTRGWQMGSALRETRRELNDIVLVNGWNMDISKELHKAAESHRDKDAVYTADKTRAGILRSREEIMAHAKENEEDYEDEAFEDLDECLDDVEEMISKRESIEINLDEKDSSKDLENVSFDEKEEIHEDELFK